MKTVAIIGGGAAGMMTAATLVDREDRSGNILLFEKNSGLGAKVIISGGGRCNITTSIYKTKELLTYYTRGAEFLKPILKRCSPKKVRAWVEANGVPTKCEADGRIFPTSNNGKDVVAMFEQKLVKGGVKIHYSEAAESIIPRVCSDGQSGGGYVITTNKDTYYVEDVVLTTGGNAFAHTGSSGDGYNFARGLGHQVTRLGPSLNSFLTKDTWIHELSGLAFPQATYHYSKLDEAGKSSVTSCTGPILLTHFGLSGPNTFVLASDTAFQKISPESPLTIKLQIHADKDKSRRETYLIQAGHSSPRKAIYTILAAHMSKRAASAILSAHDIDATAPLHQIDKAARTRIANILGGGIAIEIIGRRPGDEFVTAGGVDTKEINPKTCESLISPGLYCAGEILNVDGVTGGFNLQACRAAGYTVGNSIE